MVRKNLRMSIMIKIRIRNKDGDQMRVYLCDLMVCPKEPEALVATMLLSNLLQIQGQM